MDNKIEYLNTDLDLHSRSDLRPLANHLDTRGVDILHVTKSDRIWVASFEMECYQEPEINIKKMLKVIEKLPEDLMRVWDRCSLREFNIGYDCGAEPWAHTQALTTKLITRMAAVKASVRITIYPAISSGS